ncbi:hypothetical protein ACFLQN_01160 [Candidatus Aenigmatarchaeota archaeon]
MVSVLVGGVILIALAIVIASLVSDFSLTMTNQETEEIDIRTEQAIDCSVSNVEINDIYLNLNTNVARIFLKNSGLNEEEILAMEFFNTTNDLAYNLSSFPFFLPKGEIKTVEFNITNIMQNCEDFSYVRAVTNCIITESNEISVCV